MMNRVLGAEWLKKGILLSALLLCAPVARGEEKAPAAASEVVVLDLERGSYRGYMAWKTPVMINAEGQVHPLPEPKKKGDKDTERKPFPVSMSAPPADGWTAIDFDDSRWARFRGPAVVAQNLSAGGLHHPGNPTEWNRICLRGRFNVTDPEQVKDLRVALTYHGGVVIYVNGEELGRWNLPAGELKADSLAERYPEETYVRPDGKLYAQGDGIKDFTEFAERIKSRNRTLPARDAPDGVALPGRMLRKGINVIAIDARTAPVSDLAIDRALSGQSWQGPLGCWPHVGVLSARLVSSTGAGVVPNTGPQPGVGVANSQPCETLATWDYVHPTGKLAPLRMTGVKGGTFSGRVVLSSSGAIRVSKAGLSEMTREGGKEVLPSTAVSIRWAEAANGNVSWRGDGRFDRLMTDFPVEVAPFPARLKNSKWQPTPAAVLPLWVTMQVPADAAAGEYRGALTIEADGAAGGIHVPVELKIHDWTLPAVKDYAQRYNFYQSPDTLAQYAKVPLWSEKHWDLIGRSFQALRQLGNSVCVLNLVVKVPSLNNTESMVRWIKKSDGSYEYDYSVAEKYLDLFEKTCGKPAILELFAWEHHTPTDKKPPVPLSVTVVDPATGKTETLQQPAYDTPENEAFWKPVLTELRKRIEKRGWYDVTAMCYTSYCWGPTKEQVDIYKAIWPDGRWMNCTHSNPTQYGGTQGHMPVVYSEWVWGCGNLYNPDGQKPGPGKYPRPWTRGTERIEVANPRYGVSQFHGLYDHSPLALYRSCAEAALQSGVRGLGRMGGDFWPLPTEKPGRMMHLCDSYAAVGPANNIKSITSPGPDGAGSNERLEMFRESVQITETIAFLQKALAGGQLEGGLADRINKLLDERARYYLRTRVNQDANWLAFESSNWQDRDDRLFALAAEVAGSPKK